MRKIRYYHEDAKKDPTLNRVKHTFLDGKAITEADFLDAKIELEAFFILNGLTYDAVRDGLLGHSGIPVSVLIAEQPAVTSAALEAAADKEVATSIPLRICDEDLTDLEHWAVRLGKTDYKKLALERHKQMVLGTLSYLAGKRKDGWTLLGIKREAALADVVRECFGPAWVKRMHKTECLPARLVQQLLARKTQFGAVRVRTANQRRTVSRATAAKAGHTSRRRQQQAGP